MQPCSHPLIHVLCWQGIHTLAHQSSYEEYHQLGLYHRETFYVEMKGETGLGMGSILCVLEVGESCFDLPSQSAVALTQQNV